MKIRITGSFGYAGTDFNYTEDIPKDVVEGGKNAIDDYIEDEYLYKREEMCERLSLSIEIAE